MNQNEMANTIAELVFIPAPGVGHIVSTVEVAKLLVNRDQRLSITVLIIMPFKSGSDSAITTYIESLATNTLTRISFVELPQDEIGPPRDPKSPMTFFSDYISSHCKHVRKVVADMMSQPGPGRVAGFVIDMFCTSMIDVANEFNVPTFVFFTSSAAFLGFKLYVQTLNDDQSKDVFELSHSDTEISVPSFIKPMPTKVFPSVLQIKEGLDFVMSSARNLKKVKAIMVNTYFELETYAIESLSSDISIPPVYPVGPIISLKGESGARKQVDDDIIKWLDTQPPSSVVFLCFGSMGCFNEPQVKEIARALEQSGCRFLWSLRRPPSDETSKVPGDYEDPGVVLPEGFLERTEGIGKVIGWAPQVAVLAHSAVGGFVTHCGWNSLLESLWFGVPMATWPMYAEQQVNAFQMVVELGLAVEIKLDYKKNLSDINGNVVVTADEIESGISRLMTDSEMRTKVKAMSDKSRSAVAEGGSSHASVGCLIQDFIRNIS
ncbi:anthocyanidin 3-O-glucosyltransferase 2-like [Rutidosis leptorrhynchoides]|uniref:anthocyanidin 3-O-glucosyltransferase 2-like n=1 Tax=Rutidosis leptorrhynchoides TaxID=125765 RepID=UPI003A98FEFC